MSYSKFLEYLNYYLLAIVFIVLASCGDEEPPVPPTPTPVPEISSLTPLTLYSGELFYVKGKNFGENSYGKKILVGENIAEVELWNDTSISAKIDIEPGEYQVKIVFNDSTTINAGKLTFLDDTEPLPLQIISISPTTTQAGNTIEINGTAFKSEQGSSYVKIGNIATSEYLIWQDDYIKCRIPDDMVDGKYNVVVVTDEETSNYMELTINTLVILPVIDSMTPTSIKIGEKVELTGSNFKSNTETSEVWIGEIKCTEYPDKYDNKISFIVPAGAKTDSVKVHVGDKISNGKLLTILEDEPEPIDTPKIVSTDKEQYERNASVKISGKNFGPKEKQGKVIVHQEREATIQLWSDTVIRILLPDGAASGPIYVVSADGIKSNRYTIYIDFEDRFPTVLIKRGTFNMGNNASNIAGEAPEHQVTISYDFYMATTELTQKQYRDIMHKNLPTDDPSDEIPLHYATFSEVCEFCNALSKNAGFSECYTISGTNITCDFTKNGYRLPTEAEWEYAAKAGTNSDWGFTDSPDAHTWSLSNCSGLNAPKRVKTRTPNNWGLYDMNGNVSEWCWDNYSTSYYQECAGGVTDPKGSSQYGGSKIVRGGNYSTELERCKTTCKTSYNATDYNFAIGFRFVRNR